MAYFDSPYIKQAPKTNPLKPAPKKKKPSPKQTPPAVASSDPYTVYAQQQAAFAGKQRELEAASKRSEIDALMNRLRGDEESELAELNPRLGDIESRRLFHRGQTQQVGELARSPLQRTLTSRGLGLSGIREGAEARHTSDILRQVGGIDLQAGQETDAIRRAIERKRRDTAAEIARLTAERQGL